ncbi:beta-1,3-1,4-glucanase [Pyronema omphalodes]|nr:beta-1,3-1,4-glucanase [Pyronema omphalodes]
MNETDTTTIVFQLPNITWSSILPTSTNPTPEAGKPDDLYPGEIPGLNSTGPLIGNSTEASTGYKNLLLHAHSGNFFDQFDFFTGPDPTYGLVKYVDKSSASAKGLIGRIDRSVYIGVDSTSKLGASDTGRASVRLESKQRFTGGLFVLDVEHLPWGCGSWPAFWTFGAPWPFRGEVDIIEGVHLARSNSMVVHVASGDCSCQLKPFFTSDRGTRGIPYLANGCTPSKMSTETHLKDPRPNSYGGPGYKGGVYAMEWTKRDIKIWFFPRGTEPADLASTSTADANLEPVAAASAPNPNTWGHPVAWIPLLCGWGDRFKDHRVVINVSFCGAWAGKQDVWQASGCYHPQTAPTCEDWVRKRPETFKETYWKIRSVRVWAPKFPMGLGNDDAATEGVSSGSGKNNTAPA